ncbi:LAMI_0G02278g1_1 [Lachancea mirantina]|uniref:LAMI_0G02278g1_1 n=1 Tax=Lachancea mirantina TaxID=1230905 RepID=A0A1G4K7V7_9SACH|nr:LAMI_0G02278g1_1 [Lachancea mirantina]
MKEEYPIHEAARDGNLAKVQELLHVQPKYCLIQDLDGRYPLHWAISFQHVKIVELLLSFMKDVDLDHLADDAGWTPVHITSAVGNKEILAMLLNHSVKPDPNVKTNQGVTALHLACSKQHLDIAEVLIEHGASTRCKDSRQQLPLHRAASVGSLPLTKLLCDNNSPVNSKDIQGWTPLFHALAEGQGDVAVMLVTDYGADYDSVQDNTDKKPLDVVVDDKVKQFFLKNVQ